MKKKFCFVIMISVVFISHPCFSQENKIKSGAAVLKTLLYDGTNHRYYSNEAIYPNTNIWFKDSLIIENLKFINNNRENDILKKAAVKSLCYVFINLKNNKRNIYQNFSDTASRYQVPNYDNEKLLMNVWSSGDSILNSSPTAIPDTLVNGILYKRLKFLWGQPGKKETWIAYARCDKNPVLINLSKWASAKLGCPVSMLERPGVKENPVGYMNVIEVISEQLTARELKVFDTWETYSKTHPSKKN